MALLLDATIKVSLIVLSALVARALLRRQSAAVRHWVLAAAIVCAAATPLLRVVIPSWSVPVDLLSRFEPAPTSVQAPTTLSTDVERPLAAPAGSGSVARTLTVLADPGSEGDRKDSPRTPLSFAASLLVAVWLAGVAVNLVILLVGCARLAWLAARSRRVVQGRWAELMFEIAHEYGVRRSVRLLQSAHPTLLVTWGVVRPKIILPAGAARWDADRIRVVLCHELAHIRRHDWAVQMCAELLRAVYWFNPVMWMVCRQLRQESEQACDDCVLRHGIDGREYAWQLLTLARAFHRRRRAWLPAAAMARPSSLERRIGAMLNTRLNRTPLTRSACATATVALFCITIPIAAAQTGPASLFGTVYVPGGAVGANAKVVLSHLRSEVRHEVRSDDTGRFEFLRVPPGTYRFDVWGTDDQPPNGFYFGGVELTKLGDRVVVAAGEILHRDVTLELGPMQIAASIVWDADTGELVSPRRLRGAPDSWSCLAGALMFCGPPSLLDEFEQDLQDSRRLPTNVHMPRELTRIEPHYPAGLRGSRVGGAVRLEGRIGTDGFLTGLEVVSAAHPNLAQAALDAARPARWEPARLHGVLVEVPVQLTLDFKVR